MGDYRVFAIDMKPLRGSVVCHYEEIPTGLLNIEITITHS